jgi:hypothetical protein
VGAYWPFMARLSEAQAVAVTLHEQVGGVCALEWGLVLRRFGKHGAAHI